jgi:hypothetical protein
MPEDFYKSSGFIRILELLDTAGANGFVDLVLLYQNF